MFTETYSMEEAEYNIFLDNIRCMIQNDMTVFTSIQKVDWKFDLVDNPMLTNHYKHKTFHLLEHNWVNDLRKILDDLRGEYPQIPSKEHIEKMQGHFLLIYSVVR